MGKLRRKTKVNEEPIKSPLKQAGLDAESPIGAIYATGRTSFMGPMCATAILTETVRAGENGCKKSSASALLSLLAIVVGRWSAALLFGSLGRLGVLSWVEPTEMRY